MLFSEFVVQDEVIMDENVKQVEDHKHHEEQEYEYDDPIKDVLYNAIEHTEIMKLFENDKRDKDSYHSSTIKNGEYEMRYKIEFSKNNLPPTCHIFEDLITRINFQLSKIFGCGIKSRKCVKVERKKCFTSSISLISDNFELKRKLKEYQNLVEELHFCKN